MSDIWRDIPGFEGCYQASDAGMVRSLGRTVTYKDGRIARVPGKVLTPAVDGRGYLVVNLSKDGRPRTFAVHVVIAVTFIGPRPIGDIHVRHLDGDSQNNVLKNLKYGTRAENERDKILHGRTNRGARCGAAKLTEAQVRAIRTLLTDTDLPQREIAALFGVSDVTISQIRHRQRWVHLTEA